jgi:hypothetical protein
MRLRYMVFVATAVAGCADSPSSPLPQGGRANANNKPFLPGEQQPAASGTFNYAIFPAGAGQTLQQTFTPQANEWLGYLELPVGCGDGVLLNVKIRDGLNGPILSDFNHVIVGDADGGNFQLLQLFDPAVDKNGIRLKKGHEYAFELSAVLGPAATGTACGIVDGPAGNSYTGGRAYYQDPINGPDYLPLPTGAATDDHDLPFRTLVR